MGRVRLLRTMKNQTHAEHVQEKQCIKKLGGIEMNDNNMSAIDHAKYMQEQMWEIHIQECAGKYRNSLLEKRRYHIHGMGQKVGLPLEMKQIESMVDGFIDGALSNGTKEHWQRGMYSEEEVKDILTKRNEMFSTKIESFSNLLLKQDLEWFEQNKKKP